MSKHYFAADGSYGDAESLVVCDTSRWTDAAWDTVVDCSDEGRLDAVLDLCNRHDEVV
jgi:hypothetical protein